jgi:membrane protein DedA with SNARE-associated domain
MLDRRGTRAVLIARLLPLARTFVSLPAGARRIPLIQFTVLTTVGCALWAAAFTLGGVLAGSAWQTIYSIAGRALLGVGLIVLAVSFKRASKPRGAD